MPADAGSAPVLTDDHRELSRIIEAEQPRLVLLDLVLPGTEGIAVMESVPALADLPVIFISGYGRDETGARAFETGAADYIVKPISPTELTARVRAALRPQADPEPFRLGDLVIHYEQRSVTVASREVKLTATEYEVLRMLSVNAGRVLTFESLLRKVWHRDDFEPTRPEAGTGAHKAPPGQTGRRPGQPNLHPQRARGRIPHVLSGRPVATLSGRAPAGRKQRQAPSSCHRPEFSLRDGQGSAGGIATIRTCSLLTPPPRFSSRPPVKSRRSALALA